MIFHHTLYNELRLAPEEQPMVLLENEFEQDRAKKVEVMFESCQVPSLYIGSSSYFAFASFNVENGILIDSGFETTHILTKKENLIVNSQSFERGAHEIISKLSGYKDTMSHLEFEKLREKMEKENLGKFELSFENDGLPIYLSGGNSVFLDKDLNVSQEKKDRSFLPFLAASQISALDQFQSFLISASEYQEKGSSSVQRGNEFF